MKLKLAIFLLVVVGLVANAVRSEEDTQQQKQQKFEPTTMLVTGLVSVITPLASGLFNQLLGHLTKPNDYEDKVIYGRAMRVKMCGDNCIQISDLYSGIGVIGTGQSPQEALGDATRKIFDELLSKGLLSVYDLCRLHITFPHPNTNQCAGVIIDPCNLAHAILTTPKPCHNQMGDSYCEKNKKRCKEPVYSTYMHHNCFSTCTDGKCNEPENVDPCAISA